MINTVLDEDFLDKDSGFVPLVRKYAVLLACFLLIEITIRVAEPYILQAYLSPENAEYSLLLYFPSYLIGIVTALVVYADMKKTNTVSPAIIVLTCLYNELGVAFFLISLLYGHLKSAIGNK